MKYFQDIEPGFRSKLRRNRTLSNHPLIPVYRVGEPFRRGRHTWPPGALFTYGPGGNESTLFHSDIRQDMVHDVSRGQAEFGMIVEPPVLVLAYRFGQSIPWHDVPYSWHLQPMDWRVVPPQHHSPEARALLWISLIGAEDGIIHAQRGMTLYSWFHPYVARRDPRRRRRMAFDADDCTLAIARVFLNPATVDRLALAVARTKPARNDLPRTLQFG